jgi:Ca2+-binding EF-hand superfamily protein
MTSNNIQAQGKVIRKLDEKEKEKLIVNVLNTPRDIISSEDNQTVTGRVNSLNQKTSNIFQSNVIQESSPSVTVSNSSSLANTSNRSGRRFNNDNNGNDSNQAPERPINNSGNGGSTPRNIELIKRYDRNNDLKIDDREVAYHLLIGRKNRTENQYRDLVALNSNTDKLQDIIKKVDTVNDGVLQDSELVSALLKVKNGSLNLDQNLLDLILDNNPNKIQIKNLINAIDSDGSGVISSIEVLDTLLASKKNLIDIRNPIIKNILETNPKFNSLFALLPSYDPNFNGNISNREAYDIILALRKGNIPGDMANKALHLGNNINAREIERSIEIFDPNNDGNITQAEFVNGIINIRKASQLVDHSKFLSVIEGIPDLKNLLTAIDFIDKNKDGVFSDQEVVEMSFAIAKGNVQFPEATLNTVLASNTRARDIRTLFDRVDADDNGSISDVEVFNSFIDAKKGIINRNLNDVLGLILSDNANSQNIFNAIKAIDSDNNGQISGAESILAQLKLRRGELNTLNGAALNTVFNSSPDKEKVNQILNYLDPDANGLANDIDLFTKALNFEAGRSGLDKTQSREIFTKALLDLDEDSNVRNALLGFDQGADGVIDNRDFARGLVKMEKGEIYLSPQIFDHIKSLNPQFQIIQSAFNTLDPNNDNQISAQEFVNNFNKVITVDGQANFERLALISDVIDIFYPGAASLKAFKDAIDVDANNQLTNQELINGLLKIRRGAIVNPGNDIINAVTSTNPDSQKIISLIGQIDADNDGRISNSELANNFLKIRKNEFPAQDFGFVQAILNSNDKYNDIQNLVNLFDRNQDGNVGDLELFDALIKLKSNSYNGFVDNTVVNLLKSKNPNAAAIEGVLNNFDTNNDGKTNLSELMNGFLKINARQMPEPPAEILNSLIDANGNPYSATKITEVRNFAVAVDKNANGSIDESELIDMLMVQRNTTDSISYNQELVGLVIANNSTSARTIAMMDKIDPDRNGIITDAEVIKALQSNNKNEFDPFYKTRTGISSFQKVLSYNPRFNEIQNLYDSIDINKDGNIDSKEVMDSIIKYKDDNLQEQFRTAGSLSQDAMKILDHILATNEDYSSIQSAWASLAETSEGDLHEMMNKLIDHRNWRANNNTPSVMLPNDYLTSAMKDRLDQWQTQRANVYKQKVSDLLNKINQGATVVDTGNNSSEERLFNTITSNRATIASKTQEANTKQAELTRLQADLRDPAKINMTIKDNKGKNQVVVNTVEVNRINAAIQATQAQLTAARAAVTQAQTAAQTASDSAYAALQISATTKTLMQRVIDQAEAVKTANSSNNASYYSKMDDLLDSYAELARVLPPNKENLLSVLFFDDFRAKINTLPRSTG